jgi:hypothetical protein
VGRQEGGEWSWLAWIGGKLPALGNGTVRGCGKGVFGLFSILAT